MTMVIGLYDGLPQAQRAISGLVCAGYALHRVSLVLRIGAACPLSETIAEHGVTSWEAGSPAEPMMAAGPLAHGSHRIPGESGLCRVIRILSTAGLQPSSARFLADAINRGSALVAVHCEDRQAGDARRLLGAPTERIIAGALPTGVLPRASRGAPMQRVFAA